ncbi:uncharacterized protein LOC122787736 [Protopterus annectens]|uniref:uncharacterized protein LOC122787736 n=1 Tax=Protopterus annectens TaxID=7888 RepID=UPI001CFBDACC|nr:uncharacterized protein LOC122787736 [Protopterus annectens]XP_043910535.1 uncharacterized protein LOC122787736 [Protopterus annectens]
MSEDLNRFLVDHKEKITSAVEVLQQGCELLSSVVGDIFPIVGMVAPFVSLALECVESEETKYVKTQLQTVQQSLNAFVGHLEDINNEITKSLMDIKYFKVERNIKFLFGKLMDIANAKSVSVRQKDKFVSAYEYQPTEYDLDKLFDAVTQKESILQTIMDYNKKHRRALETFFTGILQLFYYGIIVSVAYKAIQGEQYTSFQEEWRIKIAEVQDKMALLINECINGFQQQAKEDIEHIITKENDDKQDLMKDIFEFLKEKYDWIHWSVYSYKASEHTNSRLFSLFYKESDYHYVLGNNVFQFSEGDLTSIVISYSSEEKTIDKENVQQLMENYKKGKGAKAIVEYFYSKMPGHVIHAVKQSKGSHIFSTFSEECCYLGEWQQLSLCIHSE